MSGDIPLHVLALGRLIKAAEGVVNGEDTESLDLPEKFSELEAALHFAKQSPEVQDQAVREILEYFDKKRIEPPPLPEEVEAAVKTAKKAFPSYAFHVAVSRALSEAVLLQRLLSAARQRCKGRLTQYAFAGVVDEVAQAHAYILAQANTQEKTRV